MNTTRDWEKVLKESQFDLPQARWDALEARLRQRIREDVAAPVPAAASWTERFADFVERAREWLAPAPARWAVGGSFAIALVAGVVWLRQDAPVQTASTGFHWEQGQVLATADSMSWEWTQGRSRITLRQGSMQLEQDSAGQVAIRLEEGSATFHVQHRQPTESFHVSFGACRIEVVGTAFTISRDSRSASARVIEGRVRFVGEGRDVLLDAGQELSCERPSGSLPVAASPESTETSTPSATATSPTAAALPGTAPRPSAADRAWSELAALCATSTEACTEARADFVRKHGTDKRAPEIAWTWGQTAREAGQLRDALFAWDVAARAHQRLGFRAVLAASELRLTEFAEAARAANDLDALIPRLEVGSTLWTRAWTLRRDAARRLGQPGVVATADSLLSAPRAVSGER